MATTQKCPACGAQSGGKFCSECGAPLGARACPKCGTPMSARAKFCPDCGYATPATTAGGPVPGAVATPAGGMADKMPWIIAGVAVLALLAVVIVVVGKRGGDAPPDGAAAAPFDPNRGTTDISQMSPRDAADRLFNRVMTAAEGGDTAQVQFFGPMTIQAYGNAQPLDADARLHIGMIHLLLGNPAGATAEADTIARESRTHLFGLLLRARAAEAANNTAAARQAYTQMVDVWDAERAKNLGEYGQHEAVLTQARAAARQLIGR
jgi:Double zinc ribbon